MNFQKSSIGNFFKRPKVRTINQIYKRSKVKMAECILFLNYLKEIYLASVPSVRSNRSQYYLFN